MVVVDGSDLVVGSYCGRVVGVDLGDVLVETVEVVVVGR